LPAVEGTLPPQWKTLAALQRDYFDGVAIFTNHDLLIELADGTWLAGPVFSTRNDIGDGGSPMHAGLRIDGSPSRLMVAMVMLAVPWAIQLPDGGFHDPGGGVVEHEGK